MNMKNEKPITEDEILANTQGEVRKMIEKILNVPVVQVGPKVSGVCGSQDFRAIVGNHALDRRTGDHGCAVKGIEGQACLEDVAAPQAHHHGAHCLEGPGGADLGQGLLPSLERLRVERLGGCCGRLHPPKKLGSLVDGLLCPIRSRFQISGHEQGGVVALVKAHQHIATALQGTSPLTGPSYPWPGNSA